MPAPLTWVAQPKQAQFLNATEFAVMFGGARGGGKTDALVLGCIVACQSNPGLKAEFIRRSFTELTEVGAAIPRSFEFLQGRASWSGEHHAWTFANGSIFKFGHLSDSTAINHYLGAQIDHLALDQAEQIEYDEYLKLRGSVRATIPGHQPVIRLTANPGGIGHGWVKANFIDPAVPGESFLLDCNGVRLSHRFIPAKVADNPALLERDPYYVDRLRSLGGHLAQAWLEGNWDQFEGQFFYEWNRDLHVCLPFRIPEHWPRWHATDYGITAPSCTLWMARAPSGRIYVYRERYETGRTADQQALKIKLWSGEERYRNKLLDPACWGKESNGLCIADQFATHGLVMSQANNDVPAGCLELRRLLAWNDGTNGEKQFDPLIQIFPNCINLIRTLPSLIFSQKDPEVYNTNSEDHAVDALRYGVMGQSVQPTRRPPRRQEYTLQRRSRYT